MVDAVDRERYQQTFVNAVKKEFPSTEQVCMSVCKLRQTLDIPNVLFRSKARGFTTLNYY